MQASWICGRNKAAHLPAPLRHQLRNIVSIGNSFSAAADVSSRTSSKDKAGFMSLTVKWNECLPYSLQVPLAEFTVKPCSRWAELPPRHLTLAVVLGCEADVPRLMKYFIETISGQNTLWVIEYWVWPGSGSFSPRLDDSLTFSADEVAVLTKNRRNDGLFQYLNFSENDAQHDDSTDSRLFSLLCCGKRQNQNHAERRNNHHSVVIELKMAEEHRVFESAVASKSDGASVIPWCSWRPNCVLENQIGCIEKELFQDIARNNNISEDLNNNIVTKRALDLGCGSGRDCVFLARRGWSVVGVDHVQKCIDRANAFARRHGFKNLKSHFQIFLEYHHVPRRKHFLYRKFCWF